MEQTRITIKDIAEELGLSTATISNVIHGKTKKISNRTVAKVQKKLEESGYIPNMAAVLLAQNSSKIICVVLSNDLRYENKMIEDPFISSMLNYLSKCISYNGYFMMLKEESDIQEVNKYASMWNMSGLILIGYCNADYVKLRERMRIPFVVIDAYQDNCDHFSDVGIDNIKGGHLAGNYLIQQGHKHIMFLADNDEDCDHDRYLGLVQAMEEHQLSIKASDFKLLSPYKEERMKIYEIIYHDLSDYTAAFVASDMYAIEFMNFLQDKHVSIPHDFSIIGFDNIPLASYVRPKLTTISQNLERRATCAMELLMDLIKGTTIGKQELLPVELIIRESVSSII